MSASLSVCVSVSVSLRLRGHVAVILAANIAVLFSKVGEFV